MKKILVETQLSNYDTHGKFILQCDSGWQMCIGRVREMLKLSPGLHVDIMGPYIDLDGQRQLLTEPWNVNPDLWKKYGPNGEGRLRYIEHWIEPNALQTRYDFDFENIAYVLGLNEHRKNADLRYDAVYINDPMHLRNFKALFMVKGGYRPQFFVHSHFVDVPSCPKFPVEASLWLGQCEAAIKADFNFWQCESAMLEFFREMGKVFQPEFVETVQAKSLPWDDGYSQEEITSLINEKNIRFSLDEMQDKFRNKVVIFVPNRIGGKGRSSDYTNCGKFMFDLLPRLRQRRQDFVVVCGNPSQKIFNHELEEWCGRDGYVSLVPDALNRDEFKLVARRSHIAVGLYDQDTYGGTAARECVELGCMPLWLDVNEYSSIAREAGGYPYVCKSDWSDLEDKLLQLISVFKDNGDSSEIDRWKTELQRVIRERCSYESTTRVAMERMGLL